MKDHKYFDRDLCIKGGFTTNICLFLWRRIAIGRRIYKKDYFLFLRILELIRELINVFRSLLVLHVCIICIYKIPPTAM